MKSIYQSEFEHKNITQYIADNIDPHHFFEKMSYQDLYNEFSNQDHIKQNYLRNPWTSNENSFTSKNSFDSKNSSDSEDSKRKKVIKLKTHLDSFHQKPLGDKMINNLNFFMKLK